MKGLVFARRTGAAIIAAIVLNIVVWSLLFLFAPASDPVWAVPHAAVITVRFLAFLALFAVAFSAMFLRKARVHFGRVALVAALSVLAAPVPSAALSAYRYAEWNRRVIAPKFEVGTAESMILSRLGNPTRIVPKSAFDQQRFDCSSGVAVKRLEYIPRDGGMTREFYIGANGRLICESWGIIHVWT